MVCKLARQCGNFNEKNPTCTVMNGGPRNELGHAYCGKLKEYERKAELKLLIVVEA